MSRSYKKNPISKDGDSSKKAKKQAASRSVRAKIKQGEEIGQGNAYKKYFESWDIADYVSRWTKEDAIEEYYNPDSRVDHDRYPTLESWLNFWEKCMIRK